MSDNRQSIINLPLYERRYIAVVSDEAFERAVKSNTQSGFGNNIWPLLGTVGASLVGGPTWLMMVGARKLLADRYTITEKQDPKQSEAVAPLPIAAESKAKSGAVRTIRMRDADRLKIMSGTVEIGDVYAAHPLISEVYYPLETYNDDLLEHKLSELERIINSLGAKRYSIKLEHQESMVATIAAKASRLGTGGKASADLRQSRKRRFERSGTSDGRDPVLCQDLIWYEREPAWKSLVESRLHYGRREFGLTIELERSLKMTAEVAAEVKKIASFDIDGKHERDLHLTLAVEGTF